MPAWPPSHWGADQVAAAPAPRRADVPQLSPEHEREYQLWLAVAKPTAMSSRGAWQALRGDAPPSALTPSAVRQKPQLAQQLRAAARAPAPGPAGSSVAPDRGSGSYSSDAGGE